MLTAIKGFTDRLLGRGSAAIAVPVMDGTLTPNRVIDQASVLAELPGIDDLASNGRQLWASAGPVLWQWRDGMLHEQQRFEADITALAVSPGGCVAVALGGQRLQVLGGDAQTQAQARPQASLAQLAGQPLVGLNALAWADETTLVFSDGSQRHAPAQWCNDLMTLGRSGRAGRWRVDAGGTSPAELLADGLAYAFGVLPRADGSLLVAESWRHRVLQLAPPGAGQASAKPLLAELPGYPSRLAAAAGGGFWLSCFVCRTQLVEFVLREPAYRQRMVAEIAPEHWIAPALSSGHSFLEPLQGAGVKQMGVLKPWAPPRSYGLVLRVADDGRILRSLHSQVDGRHHGITAVAEWDGALVVASKGSGRLLRVELGEAA